MELGDEEHGAGTVSYTHLDGYKRQHVEPKNPYYRLLEKEEIVNAILAEFGLSGQEAHIVNGHIPIEAKKGESPVKCGGCLLYTSRCV